MDLPRRFDFFQIVSFFSFVPSQHTQPLPLPTTPESTVQQETIRVTEISDPPSNMETMIVGMEKMQMSKRGAWSMEKDLGSSSSSQSLVLVGRVLQEKAVNVQAFIETVKQILSNEEDLNIQAVGGNRFILNFKMIFDYTRALEEGLWHFDRSLLVLKPLLPGQDPTSMEIKYCEFWVHLHDLPYFKLTQEVAKSLTESLGTFVCMDSEQLRDGWAANMRFRLLINVDEPLIMFLDITKKDGSVVAIRVTYERLPNYCYICGKLSHIDRNCAQRARFQNKDERPFGEDMRESFYRKTVRSKNKLAMVQDENPSPKDQSPPSSDSGVNLEGGHQRITDINPAYQSNVGNQEATNCFQQLENPEFNGGRTTADDNAGRKEWVNLNQNNELNQMQYQTQEDGLNMSTGSDIGQERHSAVQFMQGGTGQGGQIIPMSQTMRSSR